MACGGRGEGEGGVSVGRSGAKAAGGVSMGVTVTVKDGGQAVTVDAVKVAALFACTDDLGDWSGRASLLPEVTWKECEGATMLFEVVAGDGMAEKSFLRIGK